MYARCSPSLLVHNQVDCKPRAAAVRSPRGGKRYGSVSPGSNGGRRHSRWSYVSFRTRDEPGFPDGIVATGKQASMRSDLSTVRVVLVDEQEVVRRGVAKVLESDTAFRVVGEAGSVS